MHTYIISDSGKEYRMTENIQLREYTWWQWVLGGIFIWPFMGMVLTWVVPETGRILKLKWIWIGSVGMMALIGLLDLVEGSEQNASTQIPTTSPRIAFTQEPKATALAEVGMSEELEAALVFYDRYLSAAPLEDVASDDVGQWCLNAVLPIFHYSKAADQHKTPTIGENRERMEKDVLACLADTRNTTPENVIDMYYEAFQPHYAEVRMSPYIRLAIHRMNMNPVITMYPFTLTDITDECVDRTRGSQDLKRCLARQMVLEIPEFREHHFTYDRVRGYME